jgi:hypothetical protein
MRRLHFGVVLGTLLALGLAVGQGFSEPTADGQLPIATYPAAASPAVSYQPAQSASTSPGGLTTHVLPASGGAHALVVVDPVQKVLAVYRVDQASGEITLCSVRNITWDLQMPEYNGVKPLPQDIRKMREELER